MLPTFSSSNIICNFLYILVDFSLCLNNNNKCFKKKLCEWHHLGGRTAAHPPRISKCNYPWGNLNDRGLTNQCSQCISFLCPTIPRVGGWRAMMDVIIGKVFNHSIFFSAMDSQNTPNIVYENAQECIIGILTITNNDCNWKYNVCYLFL